jgi:hypothetical protein
VYGISNDLHLLEKSFICKRSIDIRSSFVLENQRDYGAKFSKGLKGEFSKVKRVLLIECVE